ncbi:MAG: coproporphyrinogen III oxidase, partial [Ginsengibacter sp.]
MPNALNNTTSFNPSAPAEIWIEFIHALQIGICTAFEVVDGKSIFITDEWEREEGGGGKTRVLANGNVFEKGGVN